MMIRMLLITLCVLFSSCSTEGFDDTDDTPATIDHYVRKMMEDGKKPNRLIQEKSPYLLQHAFNPVDWYPWGEEAFEAAKKENKPIFLSIGYSTCHWCHVMEHESFENDSIAAIMNEFFISIKVDREERPDVDQVYMAALQGMGQGGGWPMSMFLTPDRKPFFGGTYFPPENRYGRIGFPDLLQRIHQIWTTQREKVLESANGVTDYLQRLSTERPKTAALSSEILDACFRQARQGYDPGFGGFGQGPKFPRPVVLNFLMRYYYRTGNAEALEMAEHTMTEMSEGGVYDHLGGGFHRYSVDGEWRVPHFEKMLYDQAQIVTSSLELYQATRKEIYADIARNVLQYVMRDMTDKSGGFYSAEDADSPRPENPEEQGEGAFYVWSQTELFDLLGPVTGEIFSAHYGVKPEGNALTDPQNEFTGRNILYLSGSIGETAAKFNKSEAEIRQIIADARGKLLQKRDGRPRPHLDDKVLTSWNGLMISAFARAYQILEDPEYLTAAGNAADFVLSSLYDRNEKKLSRRYRDGQAGFEAHLDDYAYFGQALLDLYEASFELRWLEEAVGLTGSMVKRFYDTENGGFYDTSGEDESVLVRMKEVYDGAEPAGNSIALMNLLRLSDMTDNAEWRSLADSSFRYFASELQNRPFAVPQMIVAFDYSQHKTKQVILVGGRDETETRDFLTSIHQQFIPGKILMLVEESGPEDPVSGFLPFAANLVRLGGKTTAYVCEDYVCQLPTNDLDTFSGLLKKNGADNGDETN